MDSDRPDLVLARVRAAYAEGRNMVDFLRTRGISDQRAILYAYELQSGSYSQAMENPEVRGLKERVGLALSRWIEPLAPTSVCEAGVGEASTLGALGPHLGAATELYGFDTSVSRVGFAQRWASRVLNRKATLFCADIAHIPLADQSVDVVYTYHSLEPNGGRESELVHELLRICRRRLILVEPSYELGSESTRERIKRLGYVQNLPGVLEQSGARVVHHALWQLDSNASNQAALIVVDFDRPAPDGPPIYVSPLGKTPLETRSGCLYSTSEGFAFPVIDGIAVLKREHAILAAILDPPTGAQGAAKVT